MNSYYPRDAAAGTFNFVLHLNDRTFQLKSSATDFTEEKSTSIRDIVPVGQIRG
jgi:hypothetical protein